MRKVFFFSDKSIRMKYAAGLMNDFAVYSELIRYSTLKYLYIYHKMVYLYRVMKL